MITLDLKAQRGQELCRALARDVDVVVENYRTGTLERWGLGYEDLRRENPGLVMARITGFGQTGPYAASAGFADRPPLLPFFGLADTTTAVHAAFGIMVALYHRDLHRGEGQLLDLALYDGLFTLLGPHVIDYDQLGVVQERVGSRLPFAAPRNTCTFERLAQTLGIGHVVDDPDFVDNRARLRNVDRLDALVAEAIAQRPLEELLVSLAAAGAPVGPVNDIEQLLADPQLAARENVVAIDDDELGPVRMQNVVPKLSGTPGRVAHAAPAKGAHNHEVYCEILGGSEDELTRLTEECVI